MDINIANVFKLGNAFVLSTGIPFYCTSCQVDANITQNNLTTQSNVAVIRYQDRAAIITNLIQQNKFQQVEEIINKAIQNQTRSRGFFYTLEQFFLQYLMMQNLIYSVIYAFIITSSSPTFIKIWRSQ